MTVAFTIDVVGSAPALEPGAIALLSIGLLGFGLTGAVYVSAMDGCSAAETGSSRGWGRRILVGWCGSPWVASSRCALLAMTMVACVRTIGGDGFGPIRGPRNDGLRLQLMWSAACLCPSRERSLC